MGAVLDQSMRQSMEMKLTDCKSRENTLLRLLEYYVLEVTARSAANFHEKIRQIISFHLALQANEVFDECIELDVSYFGGVPKSKRGRGATGKVAVFGILKRGGKVYAVVVEDTESSTLMPVIMRKIAPAALSIQIHIRVTMRWISMVFTIHLAKGKNHINAIENCWNQAKRPLRKYNVIHTDSFPLFFERA